VFGLLSDRARHDEDLRLILADNGSNWYFQGTADTRWTYTEVDQLKAIPASQFVAVDESCLMISANSAQALQPGSAAFQAKCQTPTGRQELSTWRVPRPRGRPEDEHLVDQPTGMISVVDDDGIDAEVETFYFEVQFGVPTQPSLQYARSCSLPRMTPSEPSMIRIARGEVR